MAILPCTIAALERPRWRRGAGIAAAAALAIGVEGLPMVAATILVFALMWVVRPGTPTALRDFGLSFACATALALAQGVAPADWLVRRLDAISIVYAVAAALLAASPSSACRCSGYQRLPVASRRRSAPAGLVVAALCSGFDPALLKGPYAALDPWLVAQLARHTSPKPRPGCRALPTTRSIRSPSPCRCSSALGFAHLERRSPPAPSAAPG